MRGMKDIIYIYWQNVPLLKFHPAYQTPAVVRVLTALLGLLTIPEYNPRVAFLRSSWGIGSASRCRSEILLVSLDLSLSGQPKQDRTHTLAIVYPNFRYSVPKLCV